MEAAKCQNQFKYDHFEISLMAFSEKKLSLTVFDKFQKVQFEDKELTLTQISVPTLIKAFEQNKLEIKLGMSVRKVVEEPVLQIQVLVSSQFLKPVEETICLKKKRDISEQEFLTKAVESIGRKMKEIKEKNEQTPNSTLCGNPMIEEKYFTGATFQTISSVKLKKGRHLITFSCLAKANNQLLYFMYNQTQMLFQNGAFYAANMSYYMPYTFRMIHNVATDEQTFTIGTNYCNSYRINVKNAILSAKRVD